MSEKIRNDTVDIIRGIAMLMVVLGHTITGCTENSQSSFLFGIIWSLQMPLFFLVSGYVTKYSKFINNFAALKNYLWRRTLAYLLPWTVWTFIIRGIIFGNTVFFNIPSLIFHMDSSYWFLFTIWVVNVVFGASEFIAGKITSRRKSSELVNVITIIAFSMIGEIVLAGVGFIFGLDFLGTKLTLYYLPYFIVGYLYGRIKERIITWEYGYRFLEISIAICCGIYIELITKFDLYSISDNIVGILIRAVSSMTGCVAICGMIASLPQTMSKSQRFLLYVGRHSLEVYLIHYLLLSIVRFDIAPQFISPMGIGLSTLNFLTTLFLTVGIATLLNTNNVLQFFLFGKGIQKRTVANSGK